MIIISYIIFKENELQISAVSKIINFNETEANLIINDKAYSIKGANLEMHDINQNEGTLRITGEIYLIDAGYKKQKDKELSFFKKIFK